MRGCRREMAQIQSASKGGAYPFSFCKGLKELDVDLRGDRYFVFLVCKCS